MDGVRCDGTPAAAAGGADMDDGLRTLEARACGAWPLPGDPTCASIARRAFRRVAGALALDPEVADDGMTMVSELAANTLHARREQRQQGEQRSVTPELWLYLRGAYPSRELVCKVFDACPGWLDGNVPGRGPHPAPADATSGRGLEVVHELSQGRWGYHMTRARLGGWQVRGKAVWFAVPAPLAHARLVDVTGLRAYTLSADVSAARANARLSARQAAMKLEAMLTDRGLADHLVRADTPACDTSVLSVCRDLTVSCRGGEVSLTTPESSERWNYADLVEAAELTVQRYEELDLGAELAAAH